MSITVNGLAKLTLLDYPGHTAATVFLAGCNMRCPFCHNAPLVTHVHCTEQISEEELRAFFAKRRGLLDGIAVTGGEPTLRPELPRLLSIIKEYGYDTKLDTNGTNPEMLDKLVGDGLVDYVAMDVKNSPSRYAETAGVPGFDMSPVLRSVELLREGRVDHEFRTTVTDELHTEEDIISIGKWLTGAQRYFLQTFLDSGDLLAEGFSSYDKNETEHLLSLLKEYIPNAQIRG